MDVYRKHFEAVEEDGTPTAEITKPTIGINKYGGVGPVIVLKAGMIQNRLKVVKLCTAHSDYYNRPYYTGYIMVQCLGVDDDHPCTAGENNQPKIFKLNEHWFHMFCPRKSKYSCGCCERPRKKHKKRAPSSFKGGRPTLDLIGYTTEFLEVIKRVPNQGWKCQCRCDNTCIVPRSYQLLRGTVTACPECHPWEWKIKTPASNDARKRQYAYQLEREAIEKRKADRLAERMKTQTRVLER